MLQTPNGLVSFALCPTVIICHKKKKKFMIFPTMSSRHVPMAMTPATATADHRHPASSARALTWNDNDNFIPETTGWRERPGTWERLAKTSHRKASQPRHRTPSSAAPAQASFSGHPCAQEQSLSSGDAIKQFPGSNALDPNPVITLSLPRLGRATES